MNYFAVFAIEMKLPVWLHPAGSLHHVTAFRAGMSVHLSLLCCNDSGNLYQIHTLFKTGYSDLHVEHSFVFSLFPYFEKLKYAYEINLLSV
jgi:hypothetical protein